MSNNFIKIDKIEVFKKLMVAPPSGAQKWNLLQQQMSMVSGSTHVHFHQNPCEGHFCIKLAPRPLNSNIFLQC